MYKLFLIFFLLSINLIYCQKEENMNKAYVEVFGKCFKELESIEGTINIFPLNKNVKFCSLYQCVSRFEYAVGQKDIQEKILKRAIEITNLLYNEGTPIHLLLGAGSSGEEYVNNESLSDDNNLVYISIAECIFSQSLLEIQEAVNKETTRLLNSKK